MRRIGLIVSLIMMSLACISPISAQITPRYMIDTTNFANPERGFYHHGEILYVGTAQEPYTLNQMLNLRNNQGISLMLWYLLMDEFVTVDTIPQGTLDYLNGQFALARQAGMKVIPRVSYTSPTSGSYPYTDPDAPLARILLHINQLTPVLVANADVIAFMEIGFVGAWGEWHSSTNLNVNDSTGINDNSRAIISALLDALPSNRMVAMRRPTYKQQLYGNTPLTSQQAYNGSPQARMGAHNDCFLASSDDYGTYPSNPQQYAAIRQYLSTDNQYLPQGGETCNAGSDAQPYIGCTHAVADLELLHFSTLNILYNNDVLDVWREQGCFDSIAKRLGYRLNLVDAPTSTLAVAGDVTTFTFSLQNTGFASPYNPRGFEIILRSQVDNQLYHPTLLNTPDPRRWLPSLGAFTLPLEMQLPADIPVGDYDVLLNLPDPLASLHDRPEYSIRLATQGVWEANTGYNNLMAVMTVTAPGQDLLTNGGFELAGLSGGVPDGWTLKSPSGDKRACPAGKAYSGACAFKFTGSTSDKSKLVQVVDTSGMTLNAGDSLTASAYFKGNNTSAKVKLILTVYYASNPTPVKTIRTVLRNASYTQQALVYTLSSGDVSHVSLMLNHMSNGGTLWVDDVRLTLAAVGSRRGAVLTLPTSGEAGAP